MSDNAKSNSNLSSENRDRFPSKPSFEAQLRDAMITDRFPLGRLWTRIDRRLNEAKPTGRDQERLEKQLADSLKRAKCRQSSVPKIEYDDELPVSARRDELARTIEENQVVVVCGETGSGKSTQLPKICLELGRGVRGMIGHTQPRRLAARSIGQRVAEEIGSSLGALVGFKIRFADKTSPETLIKLMTDGILLAETARDRHLDAYDTIILDEAHERSLNIDFLIGYLRRLLPKRPDLKVIITSATIDAERFAEHFSTPERPVPVIEVSGRTYPVEILYRPPFVERRQKNPKPGEDEIELEELDPIEAVRRAVDELAREGKGQGDMLVFLPTERDIHEAVKALRSRPIPGDSPGRETEILPLYARLPGTQQQQIFRPGARRRIVLATNVAESSLTVPRIHYVIDTGTARISRYSARSRTQRLPIESISRASADQRAGRCGRIAPGKCIRLYAEEDFLRRDQYTQPEIQRSNLASVILQAKALRLGDLENFPFLDPPKTATIRDGMKTLFEIGAIDEDRELSQFGRTLSRLPVDPRIGRIVFAGAEEQCLREILIIAAALEVQDPRVRPLDRQAAADEAHGRFQHESSDFLFYLKLWDFYHEQKQKLSRSRLRKVCQQNFLSFPRMREWIDIHRQLKDLAEQAGLRTTRKSEDEPAIHRAILTGFLSGIAFRSEKYQYTAARQTKAHVWPGSAAFTGKPAWLVASELIETDRRYLRCCARIEPDWIEPLAEHLVKRTYQDPHWSKRNQAAMATERVTLFGLLIVPGRSCTLGSIDPEMARQLLIRHGLVEGALRRKPDFVQHNEALVEEVQTWQKKYRRANLMRGEWALYEFYDERIPEHVYDFVRLEQWWKKKKRTHPDLLRMQRHDVAEGADEPFDGRAFPDALEEPTGRLPIRYEFSPGTEEDGLTLEVPTEGLGQLDSGRIEWLVPGLLEAKIAALIKTLAKPVRRRLVPAPDTAHRVAGQIEFGEGPFLNVLANILSRIAGERIGPSDFDLDRLPGELRMTIAVVDEGGETIARGKDLDTLQGKLGREVADRLATIDDPQWNRDGITAWDFDELPESVSVRRGQLTLRCYPALVDRGDSVSLELTESAGRAAAATRAGLVRLFARTVGRDLKKQVAWLPGFEKLVLSAASIPGFQLQEEAAGLLASRAFPTDKPIPRTREAFDAQVAEGRERIGLATQEVAELLPKLLQSHYEARLAVEKIRTSTWDYAKADMTAQLDRLTESGFLIRTPTGWLAHYPRYFQAVTHRIDRLQAGSLDRDRRATGEMNVCWEAYCRAHEESVEAARFNAELVHLRWMLEEYRVSLFAERLKTAVPVSAKRIERQWEKVRMSGAS